MINGPQGLTYEQAAKGVNVHSKLSCREGSLSVVAGQAGVLHPAI